MPRFRREPFRFLCPYCGGCFFLARVSLVRTRHNRFPDIEAMGGDLKCDDCGFVASYQDFVDQHRGWL